MAACSTRTRDCARSSATPRPSSSSAPTTTSPIPRTWTPASRTSRGRSPGSRTASRSRSATRARSHRVDLLGARHLCARSHTGGRPRPLRERGRGYRRREEGRRAARRPHPHRRTVPRHPRSRPSQPAQRHRIASRSLLRKESPRPSLKPAERILASAARINNMVTQLLDLTRARIGGGIVVERRRIVLNDVVTNVVDELAHAHPGREDSLLIGPPLRGHWDGERLGQVVSNLVANALQHGAPTAPVEVRLASQGSAALLEVHNFGPAIPADLRAVLFEPYRSGPSKARKAKGLGLGLFITRQIVLAHGGELTVSRERGRRERRSCQRGASSPRRGTRRRRRSRLAGFGNRRAPGARASLLRCGLMGDQHERPTPVPSSIKRTFARQSEMRQRAVAVAGAGRNVRRGAAPSPRGQARGPPCFCSPIFSRWARIMTRRPASPTSVVRRWSVSALPPWSPRANAS